MSLYEICNVMAYSMWWASIWINNDLMCGHLYASLILKELIRYKFPISFPTFVSCRVISINKGLTNNGNLKVKVVCVSGTNHPGLLTGSKARRAFFRSVSHSWRTLAEAIRNVYTMRLSFLGGKQHHNKPILFNGKWLIVTHIYSHSCWFDIRGSNPRKMYTMWLSFLGKTTS